MIDLNEPVLYISNADSKPLSRDAFQQMRDIGLEFFFQRNVARFYAMGVKFAKSTHFQRDVEFHLNMIQANILGSNYWKRESRQESINSEIMVRP